MYRGADVRREMGFVCPFVLALAFLTVNCVEERCSIDDESSCERGENAADKYSRDSNFKLDEYSLAMEEAERNYVECRGTGCDCFQEVITRDTRPFEKKGIGQKLIDMTKSRGTFYQIIKNNLYRQKECTFPSRCAGIEHFILKVIEKLPDMDLIVNTRDYPQSSKYFGEPLPVFSFSKTPDYFDITYPAWGFWEGGPAISLYPRGLGRWDRHRISLDRAAKTYPWDRKTGKAFFRGSRTSSERDNLILLSRNKSDLVDARYTRNQAWKSDEDTLHAPPAPEVPLEEHCAYKYLFNYRGVAASFRHKHLFLCGSLVFHVGDEWTEFYYDAMKPWIHYVPVPKNAREETLEKLIRFAKDNDDSMRRIASRGRDFVWRKLRMADITCFWESLLRRYGKLLTYEPTLVDDLIRIEKE